MAAEAGGTAGARPARRGDATVVGAGVVGLTAALRLVEDGWRVRVLAADPPRASTSAVAAAIWFPYRAAPQERVGGWAARSLGVLRDLARDRGAGVVLRRCTELLRVAPALEPWWREAAGGAVAPTAAEELPEGYAAGWDVTLPVVVMPVHLGWLEDRLAAHGVTIEPRRLRAVEEAPGDLVVVCAGLGARDLVGDGALTPVRGQVVVVEDPGLERAWLDDETDPARPTYVIPRGRDCVLGGTAQAGAEDLEPDPAVAEDILARCVAIEPRLVGARVIGHRVGLRPARPAVRLDAEEGGARRVLHCYGHGGAGVTLSWGCAEEVAALARA
jgi:D-amino-acid oxidase